MVRVPEFASGLKRWQRLVLLLTPHPQEIGVPGWTPTSNLLLRTELLW